MTAAAEHVVYKYVFSPREPELEVNVPALARVVLFAFQGDALAVWIVRPQADVRMEMRVLRIVATGEPFPAGWAHRGSAMTDGGRYVFHLFEAEKRIQA